jgi:hypothetical protein
MSRHIRVTDVLTFVKYLAEILEDAPITPLICVSKCGTGDIATEAYMIEQF